MLCAADRPVGADRRGRGFAVVLGVVLGVPDQIFATVTQYAFLAAVATVGTTATWRGPHGFRLTCTPTGPGEGAP